MLVGYFQDIYEFLYNLVDTFIQEIFGDGDEIIIFLLITIPIIFMALEAIFDFLIPTFLGGNPLFIRKWISPNVKALKAPELKAYAPAKVNTRFNNILLRYRPSKSALYFNKFSKSDIQHFQKLYQAKYNSYPKPWELKRFMLKENKEYKQFWFYNHYSIQRFKDFAAWVKSKRKVDTSDDVPADTFEDSFSGNTVIHAGGGTPKGFDENEHNDYKRSYHGK